MSQCIAPITIKNPRHKLDKREYAYIDVPCGKCPPCIKRRVQGWMFRLKKEQEVSISSSFITLTYEDEHLPFSPNGLMTLDKRDHQLFMKKLRKHLDTHDYNMHKDVKLKYYAIGEYGDNTHRPHFHYIMFNLPDQLIVKEEIIQDIWSKGLVQVAVCNDNTIAYVTGYVNKKLYAAEKVGLDDLDDRLPECSMMSKGLGKNFLSKRVVAYYQEVLKPYIIVEDGKKQTMPRYYRHKLYNEHQRYIIAKQTEKYLEENQPYKDGKHEKEHKAHIFNKSKTKYNEKRKRDKKI